MRLHCRARVTSNHRRTPDVSFGEARTEVSILLVFRSRLFHLGSCRRGMGCGRLGVWNEATTLSGRCRKRLSVGASHRRCNAGSFSLSTQNACQRWYFARRCRSLIVPHSCEHPPKQPSASLRRHISLAHHYATCTLTELTPRGQQLATCQPWDAMATCHTALLAVFLLAASVGSYQAGQRRAVAGWPDPIHSNQLAGQPHNVLSSLLVMIAFFWDVKQLAMLQLVRNKPSGSRSRILIGARLHSGCLRSQHKQACSSRLRAAG